MASANGYAMKDRIGGDVISLTTKQPARVAEMIREKFQLETETVDGVVRLERGVCGRRLRAALRVVSNRRTPRNAIYREAAPADFVNRACMGR